MCPILWIYAGFYSSRCQTDSHLRPLLGLNFENWLITQDQRACSDASTTVQPRSIRCCRCVHFHLHVIQPTQGSFRLFLLAVDTLGSYLMSNERLSSAWIGHCVASLNAAFRFALQFL